MCGIFGFIDHQQNFDQRVLERMGDLLKHRGPDASGYFIDPEKNVYLGHNRLSIIDLSAQANQPLSNENGSLQLIFNGEIYNFKDLRKELINQGHVFETNTDSEVIIHAWEEYGEDSLNKFNGMFAFVLWDKHKNQLILARDRIGIKPLYYWQRSNLFAWASEIKAFKALGSLELNNEAVKKLLGFQYLPSNRETTVKNIYKIPPAHYLIYKLDQNECVIKRYWQLKLNEQVRSLPFDQALKNLEVLLVDSVKLQLIADVKVGIMLSGGLDSSVIAALAQKYSNNKVYTYTAGFDDRIDERPYAKIVAEHIGSEHEEVIIDPKQIIDDLEQLISHFDDLNTFDGGLLTNYLIAEKMKARGTKVILLGEGADEIFGGYSWFGLTKLPFKILPGILKKYLYYYSTSRNLSFNTFKYFKEINPLFASLDGKSVKNTFDLISAYEILYQLPNHYLMKVDKGTMAQSVEARVPYLDHRVVEFAYSLKTEHKLRGSFQSFSKINEKYILRELAKKYLPDQICQRKKKGGMLPVAAILRSNLGKIKNYLLDENSLSSGIFNRQKIEGLLNQDNRQLGKSNWHFGDVEREIFLWKLFILEVWYRLFFVKNG